MYISNIPHDVTQQQLEEIFTQVSSICYFRFQIISFLICGQAGVIKEVRLVTNRQGRSKGFAYIEYITEVIQYTPILTESISSVSLQLILLSLNWIIILYLERN